MVVIFVIALLIFGPRKLPELGRSLGKGLSEFKRASNDLRNTLDEEIRSEERRAAITTPPTEPAKAPDASATTYQADATEGESDTVARGQHPA